MIITGPVLYGDVWVDALVAQVVDVGAQVFARFLHVVEGGGEVCLKDAHTLLHTNKPVLCISNYIFRIRIQAFRIVLDHLQLNAYPTGSGPCC